MSKIVSNYTANGNSQTDEYGTLISLSRLLGGSGVIQGMAVVANSSPAMNVYVQPGTGLIAAGTAPTNYSYFVGVDTSGQGEQVTIATANTSPRIDYIVGYVNKSQVASTASINNTNNVLMFAAVQGTPSGSPVVPTVTQIQTAIGAANPYFIYAQIAVGASVSQITNANITDKRVFVMAGPAQYKFSAYYNGTAALSGSSKVPFNVENFDTGANYDNTTNFRFTAPVAGFYFFAASASFNSTTATRIILSFYKNGVEVLRAPDATKTIDYGNGMTWFVQLAAGDYIEVFTNLITGASAYNYSIPGLNLFSGYLVSAV